MWSSHQQISVRPWQGFSRKFYTYPNTRALNGAFFLYCSLFIYSSRMSRYFFQIMYDGTDYSGWQRQDNAPSVQESIEECLSSLCRRPTPITGCGRTDAGVHAADYFFHCDIESDRISATELRFRMNKILPGNIAVVKVHDNVPPEAHARFDATSRAYIYDMHLVKDPFCSRFSFRYNQSVSPDFDILNKAASVFLDYGSFFPFCKTHTDVLNYDCVLEASHWVRNDAMHWSFHVQANRFLRGMVRLMVGACIKCATGKLSLDILRHAMETQSRLDEAWSVPACGLRLSKIQYPYIK